MQSLSISLILMMILQFSGCANTTSAASAAPSTDGGASPIRKSQSELTVGADPYYANRQISKFGLNMSQKGLLPVMVSLRNNGTQTLKVVPGTISLELQGGGVVEANSLPIGLLPAPAPPPPPPSETTDTKAGRIAKGTALVALYLVTQGMFPLRKSEVETQREKLQKEIQKTELREVTLAKGESTQGFVYFYIPQGIQQATGASLIVPYLPALGRGEEVRVPLGGM